MRQCYPGTGRAGDRESRLDRHIRKVGRSCEGPFATEQKHQLAAALHPDLSGKWQDEPLELPAGDHPRLTRGESHDIQASVFPARLPRPYGHLETCPAGHTCLAMPLTHDAPPWTSSVTAWSAVEA